MLLLEKEEESCVVLSLARLTGHTGREESDTQAETGQTPANSMSSVVPEETVPAWSPIFDSILGGGVEVRNESPKAVLIRGFGFLV